MTRVALPRTRATLRTIGVGPSPRRAITRTAEIAAAEERCSLVVFARVIARHGDALSDAQLTAISDALGRDLPMGVVGVDQLGEMVLAAMNAEAARP